MDRLSTPEAGPEADPEIRPAGPGDAPAIAAVTRAAYAKWAALTGREPLPMGVDYAAALAAHDFALVEEAGALVALIETRAEADALLIVNLAVRPDCQGRALGRRLMAHAEALARAAGLARTRLYTNRRFTENLRFYTALGYAADREEAMNGGVAVHMSKAVG
jgi:ribosomal protein S18 acetylase RimI-like enzyme